MFPLPLPRSPRRPLPGRRRAPVARISLAALGLLAACGGPAVGGSGALHGVPGGGPAHLMLEGTPYEQGWWQGRLLKDRIQALHEAWQRAAFAADGDLGSETTRERRRAALVLVDPVLARLPEALRQELEGLSQGCALPVRTLLLTELLTDVLRFTEDAPRLLQGAVGRAGAHGLALRLADGPWRALVEPALTWVTRRSRDGSPSLTLLAVPGSLGGLLCARGDGLAAAALEAPLPREEQLLGDLPFGASLRLALAGAADAEAVWSRLVRSTGHDVTVLDLARGMGRSQRWAHVPGEPADPVELPQGLSVFGVRRGAAGLEAFVGSGADQRVLPLP